MAGADTAAVMAQARAENFPVASWFLPRDVRAHLLALYGFARLIDDAGDEARGDRLALLDELQADLERVWTGRPRHPLIARLQPTVASCELPIEPFGRLIEANRRDQLVSRYDTYEQLLDYCTLSANCVGELVLLAFGLATPARIAQSDQVCTALQLAEHWQDVAEDYAAGRIYLPREDRERFGVGEGELGAGLATPALRALMEFQVQRARRLLDSGAPLVGTLGGRPKLAVAAFVAGGRSALGAIERAGYDVIGQRPRPRPARRAFDLASVLLSGLTR